jgi:hypothetical protein
MRGQVDLELNKLNPRQGGSLGCDIKTLDGAKMQTKI